MTGEKVLIGYMRVSRADGSRSTNLQRDALIAVGVSLAHLCENLASDKRDNRPRLAACPKTLREGDMLIVWKLDRLGRDLCHPVNTVHDLTTRSVGLRVLTGHDAAVDMTTAAGKLVFGIFATLAEFECELISERAIAGFVSMYARGRKRERPFKMTTTKLHLTMTNTGQPEIKMGDLYEGPGITRQTLYQHVSPKGGLRPDGVKLLSLGSAA